MHKFSKGDHRKEQIEVSGRPAPKATASFSEGASHRSDGLILPEARLKTEGGRALEFDTASVLKEPVLMGASCSPSANGCAALLSRSCISVRVSRQIAKPFMACNFQPPDFLPHRLHSPNAWPRRHASPETGPDVHSGSDCIQPSIEAKYPNRPANRAFSELRLSPRHARQPLQDATNYLYDRYRYL